MSSSNDALACLYICMGRASIRRKININHEDLFFDDDGFWESAFLFGSRSGMAYGR